MRLWDVADSHAPAHTATLPGDHGVTAVAFSPDGRTLAATTGVGVHVETVELWDVEWIASLSGNLHDWSCGAAGGLTADEWAKAVPGIPFRRTC